MKMFLTRLGFGSQIVVTGDVTQIDLPRGERSGLIEVGQILDEIDDIAFVRFSEQDVVRHKLVQHIVSAYAEHSEELENQRQSRKKPRRRGSGDDDQDV
jgi:phosphate starvation-inducible PhoH-like protein